MKKILILFIFFIFSVVYAGDIARFDIKINPNPTKVGNSNDVIIKAVDENGNIVSDYVGDAYINIYDEKGNDITDNVESLPGDGVVSFDLEDQGEKIYSKSLIINDPGTYKFEVTDITDESIKGEVQLVVNDNTTSFNNNITIDITSPVKSSILSKLPIVVSASTNSPNTIYKLYLNGNEISSGLTDENGQIQDVIDNLEKGKYTLQIKLFDAQGNVLGESDVVNFEFSSQEKRDVLDKVDVLPSEVLYQNDNIEIKVKTKVNVEKVVISINKNNTNDSLIEQADKIGENIYSKKFKLTEVGKYNISVKIFYNGKSKEYNNIEQIKVLPLPEILNVKVKKDLEKGKIIISWTSTGDIKSFKVLYGNDKNNLNKEKLVNDHKIELTNIDISKNYYFKIIPLNEYGQELGKPSDIILVSFNKKFAPACKVDNIKLRVVKENNKRYLKWGHVDGVEKYIVYKSDSGDKDSFVKVAELTGTKWEYPFDFNAKKVKYSYFKVIGVCKEGGKEIQIGNVKKVKVGPEKWILFIILGFVFIYSVYLVYARYK